MIEFAIRESEQTLILTDAVLAHFSQYRQCNPDAKEAGGQLFAKIDGHRIVVERATGPRGSDHRSRFSFIPNRLAERREIKRLFKAGFHYVGDWHTHAEPYPRPSSTDANSMRDMFRQSVHQLAGFVMVIVGNAPPPDGLFVSIVNGDRVQALSPPPILGPP